MRWIEKTKHKVIFAILFYLFLDQQIFSQDFQKENVKFLLDCWKYHFGWKTLGGGYVRHILLFTESHIIDIETKEVSRTPGYSKVSFDPTEFFDREKILLLPPALLLHKILSDLLPDREKEMKEEVREAINLASENPTVENFVSAIKTIIKGSKENQVWKYAEIEDIEVKRKGNEVNFKFKSNEKKHNFISRYENQDRAKTIESVLKNLFKFESSSEVGEQNYLSVYTQEIKEKEKYAKHTAYIEAFGQGLLGTFNYDYRFHPNLSLRVGAGTALLAYSMVLTVNLLSGIETPHHLELGAGLSIFSNSVVVPIPTVNLGYRFQPKNGGFFFKIAFTPLLGKSDEFKVWGGISIGWTFKN